MARKLKTKTADIRKLTDADFKKEMEEAQRRLFSVRLQMETRQIANHRELPQMKRQIARLKTIAREKQLAASARKAAQ